MKFRIIEDQGLYFVQYKKWYHLRWQNAHKTVVYFNRRFYSYYWLSSRKGSYPHLATRQEAETMLEWVKKEFSKRGCNVEPNIILEEK